ncbi:DUF1254 domain-containing protein [uncultured Desulfosarcina sp.]|uniref:DUF1254 domain-containing protein n=1 Tax=uncultured Desulfosarcina sp. TaxID=218289 RepID=UPI0029C8207C|nr:DUF1254 domain-containing protein [uncultured Desulfosarcina sp.]
MKKAFLLHVMIVSIVLQTIGAQAMAADRFREIGSQAYIYGFPMVLMEITRRVSTNVETTQHGGAPMDQFCHVRAFPDHTFTNVVRPNADTLYSTLWFDVSKEPLILSIADTGGRYFMLPILDMWTDVVAVPGSRTTGTGTQTFAIVGPEWQGKIPDKIEPLRCPTSVGWIIGRTQTNGKADYPNVHKMQNGYTVTPLSRWGKPKTAPPKGTVNASWDTKTPPHMQVLNMKAGDFFGLFAELLKNNPPHEVDWNMVQLLRQIGIVPGESFDISKLSAEKQKSLELAVNDAKKLLTKGNEEPDAGGWAFSREFVGNYGTSYMQRAHIALIGLGANIPEDAVYPMTKVDSDGNPYSGKNRYVLHFEKDALPPVQGFWSLTMYNEKMFFVDNPINRYAIGDRDSLKFNKDGSLDIYIQHASPGKDKEANWLPAPAEKFDLTMRLYWPNQGVLTGAWNPPSVKRVD